MTSERTGLYRVLRTTAIYNFVQRIVGSERGARIFVEEYLRPQAGSRILDIGAGTGAIVERLGEVEYLGIEPNPSYVDDFNARWSSRAIEMLVGTTDTVSVPPASFDLVLILSVLHHVNDELARRILNFAAQAVSPIGRIVVLDPVLHRDQSFISRQLVRRDRGKHVRDESDYALLFEGSGLHARFDLRKDLNSFPYSHVITTATLN